MLSQVIGWSLRHRAIVLIGWLAIAAAGVLALARLPFDAFPDVTPVQVQVNVPAEALSPLEIERQVTARLEQVLSGLPGLVELQSLSRFGFSQVTATFDDETDVWLARQVVAERVAGAGFPGDLKPTLGPVATGLGEVFHYLVTGEASLEELRSTHDWLVKPQLAAVPGVAEVNAWGGDKRQMHVVVDPTLLQARGLTLGDVVEALERDNANVGGGLVEGSGEASPVQAIGIVAHAADVEAIVVTWRDGLPVRVGDVARVVEGREIRRGAVTADGKGEVVLGLGFMLVGENSHDVTARLRARLEEVRKNLPANVEVETVYERTGFVDRVLHTVRENLFFGAVLVVAILFAFLGSFRAGLVVASAIPLSLLFAFDLMTRVGVVGSLMSLGAIDFGLVVDSSVIVVENTMRRLSQEPARPRLDVVRDAAIEVRRPTLFGEFIIMAVYLPILALEGVEGKLFRPMALTVIFALLGSLLLSLTLTPVLSSLLLPRRPRGENALVRGLQRAYAPLLHGALRRRGLVMAGAAVLVALAGVLATRLGSEFVPRLREGALVINTVRMAGVSLDESARYGTQIERVVLEEFPDEVRRAWTRTGTAEVATDPMGIEVSDVFITLTPRKEWKRARTQEELVVVMQEELSSLPGMRMIFTQPIEMRVNEMAAGIRADVGVKVFGEDFDVLQRVANEVQAVITAVPGAADVSVEQVTGQPIVEVVVDREAVARHGLAARDVLAVVEALGGVEVGEVQQGERRFPLVVRLDERYRASADALGGVLVVGEGGERVALSQVAEVRTVQGPMAIQREWGRRRVIVQANVRGRDVGTFVRETQDALDRDVRLPDGVFLRFGGQFEQLERAQRRLAIVVPLALAVIFTLLWFTYRRTLDALRVFTGVPFAAVGGVLALWLRDLPFSLPAAVGFIALSGVSVLGDMVLVSTIRQLLAEGMERGEAVREAARRRLRPVLMTALVASFGFLPMALNTGPGAEVQRPLATVVIGGVLSSTLLTLLVLPVLYDALARKRPAAPRLGAGTSAT